MNRPRLAPFLALAALAIAGAASAQNGMRAVKTSAGLQELLQIDAPVWRSAPVATVTMLPQNVIAPRVSKAGVMQLTVRAVHNREWIAFHVEWPDPTRSDRIVVDNFGDQVAVELPVKPGKDAPPSPMMGNPGGRVTILQWRAAFQRDLDYGEPKVRDLYPFAHTDVYPDQVLRATDVRPYMGAIGLDNPISHPNRTPVLDQMAEGWGTMTVKPVQRAEGRGAWSRGRWQVVIAYPLAAAGDSDPSLKPGSETVAAFAVWEGGTREVGSRKAWSNWVPLKIE